MMDKDLYNVIMQLDKNIETLYELITDKNILSLESMRRIGIQIYYETDLLIEKLNKTNKGEKAIMGTSINYAKCDDCFEEFGIVLEWTNKKGALEIINKTVCPNCGSDNWHFTDRMGQ